MLHRTGVMAVCSQKESCRVRLGDPDPIVERAELVRQLAARLQASGGRLLLGYRFQGFSVEMGLKARFLCNSSEVEVGVKQAVLGADGVFSQVARAAGIRRPSPVPILQAEVTLPNNWDPNVTQVWFDTRQTRFFYWLIPESKERGVVGLVADDPARARRLLDGFLECQNLQPKSYQAAQVALHHPRLRPWGKIGPAPVYLVGDAAGQVKVTTVGGTVPGFLGARVATRALLKGTSYRRELRGLKRELDLHWWMRRALDRLDNHGYDQLISSLSGGAQNFLSRYNRDSMACVLWRLPVLEPRLMKVALSCLLGSGRNRGPRLGNAQS